MVFVRDEGSAFDVPLEEVWGFLDEPDRHTRAHEHRAITRERTGAETGVYSWEQSFDERNLRFTMRWRSYYPLGIVYEVLAGPFEGSRFFLYYLPLGDRTGVSIVGDFRSPTIAEADLPPAVARFFAKEFEQDHRAMLERVAERGSNPRPEPRR